MNCYQCGCRLTENDFCTNCGADVSRFKKIVRMSNISYNAGLEKAQVRDLSGAIVCLKESLKLNKNHIEARNLLGLVYFEMGETVSALNEWVISKNIQPKKNIADDYINEIQANPGKVDTLNQTIKKYNQALTYCQQGSLDLAVIQLKKVLSLNLKFVKAHQLLALLYMNSEDWEKARRELMKCTAIDANNTMTLRYLKEVNSMLNVDELPSQKKKKEKDIDQAEERKSDPHKVRDVGIKPIDMKEPSGFGTVINIIIGAVIGVLIAWFLILPARINNVREGNQTEIDEYIQTLSQKNEEIQNKTNENSELISQIAELQSNLTDFQGTNDKMSAYEQLTYAVYLYLSPDYDEIAVIEAMNQIEDIDYQNGTQNFKAAYDKLFDLVAKTAAEKSYSLGMTEYNSGNYETAITYLLLTVKYNDTDQNALYNLANAYRRNGNDEQAIATYTAFIEKFPDSSKVSKAQNFLKDYE